MPNTPSAGGAFLPTATYTGATFAGNINADFKVTTSATTYTSNATPTAIPGFSWTVVPGTYIFEVNLPTTMTTTGGASVAFVSSATLASIQYQTYASTAADASTAVSTSGTTVTGGTKVFDSKTAAYTTVNIRGSMVVTRGGVFTWQASQNTSASGADATTIALGAYAKLSRVS